MSTISLEVEENPYKRAEIYSSYAAWRAGKLVRVSEPNRKLPAMAETIHKEFRAHVLNSDFPCVGAKAAINGNCYRFGYYPEMNSRAATAGLAHDLWNYVQEQPKFASDYATFVASFAAPVVGDEKTWENLLWTQLQNLHRLDRHFYEWDESVGSDPEKADFSFSFAETAFFVVGLNPVSSRLSRRFRYPTLIFNVHAQFERLREENKFERMKQIIRARDLSLQGSLNPNLSNFGEQSEARQYSGRPVEKNWKCPFQALLNKTGNSDE